MEPPEGGSGGSAIRVEVLTRAANAPSRQDGESRSAAIRQSYLEGPYLSDGQQVVVKSIGATFIVVFSYADGTRKAIGVGCGVGGCGPRVPYMDRPRDVTLIPVSG